MKKRLLPILNILLGGGLLMLAAYVIYIGMGRSEADRLCRERLCYICHTDAFSTALSCLNSRKSGQAATPLIIEAIRRQHPDLSAALTSEANLQTIAEEITRRQLPSLAARQESRRGERLYLAKCAACHGNDGLGQPGQYPPLLGSEWLTEQPSRLPEILSRGLSGPISVKGTAWDEVMLPPGLLPADHEPLIRYLRERFARP